MNEENKVNVEEENQSKVKQTTVRYFEDDLSFIAQESKELGIPQYEVVKSFRKSYERLKSTTQGSQQGKLKDVINYTDSIVNLFKSLADSCDELVKQEQENALTAEQRYDSQVIKHNEFVNTAEVKEKEYLAKIKTLENEISNFQDTKKSVDALEAAHVKEIAVKDKEIADLNTKLEDFATIQADNLTLKSEIARLEEAAAASVINSQKALLDLREKLQNDFAIKLEKVYSTQTEKVETARQDVEKRMRNELKNEVARIRQEHKEELERIRKEQQAEIDRIRQEHQSEVQRLTAQPKKTKEDQQ